MIEKKKIRFTFVELLFVLGIITLPCVTLLAKFGYIMSPEVLEYCQAVANGAPIKPHGVICRKDKFVEYAEDGKAAAKAKEEVKAKADKDLALELAKAKINKP